MKNPQGLNTAAVKSGGTITLDGSGAITYTGTGIAVSVSPVPMLMSKGTGYEWAQTGTSNNILTAWNTDTQYGSIVSWRSSATNWPLTMIQEAGTGHFWINA